MQILTRGTCEAMLMSDNIDQPQVQQGFREKDKRANSSEYQNTSNFYVHNNVTASAPIKQKKRSKRQKDKSTMRVREFYTHLSNC